MYPGWSNLQFWLVGATQPISDHGEWRNSTKTQQTCRTPRSRTKVKKWKEEVAEEAEIQNSQDGDEKDPAESVRRHYWKYPPSVWWCGLRTQRNKQPKEYGTLSTEESTKIDEQCHQWMLPDADLERYVESSQAHIF